MLVLAFLFIFLINETTTSTTTTSSQTELLNPCDKPFIGRERLDLGDDDYYEYATRWFAWGQLYSFCKHHGKNDTSGKQVVECQKDADCRSCMSVCSARSDDDRQNICDGCKDDSCRRGCGFYNEVCAEDRCYFDDDDSVDDDNGNDKNERITDGPVNHRRLSSVAVSSELPVVTNFSTSVEASQDAISVTWNNVENSSVFLLGKSETFFFDQINHKIHEPTKIHLHPFYKQCLFSA